MARGGSSFPSAMYGYHVLAKRGERCGMRSRSSMLTQHVPEDSKSGTVCSIGKRKQNVPRSEGCSERGSKPGGTCGLPYACTQLVRLCTLCCGLGNHPGPPICTSDHAPALQDRSVTRHELGAEETSYEAKLLAQLAHPEPIQSHLGLCFFLLLITHSIEGDKAPQQLATLHSVIHLQTHWSTATHTQKVLLLQRFKGQRTF